MIARADFVAAVRSYIGTPYFHCGRIPGVALDCAGVPICALDECGYPVVDAITYGPFPTVDDVERWLFRYGRQKPLEDALPGDILTSTYSGKLGHLMVLVAEDRVVQARARRGGSGKVVETGIGRSMPIRSCWQLKGIV